MWMTKEQMRQSSVPHIAAMLSQMVGDSRYLTPLTLLSDADCPNCEYSKLESDGCHCYMFRSKPEGNKCGQFKKEQN
jgi:hypothetical protein